MKITEIIARLTAGVELTPEEKNFLENYQEPDQRDRIPKSRLDQEIARKKELEQRLEEITHKLDEYENQGLSESEKHLKTIETLKQQLDVLTRERDEAINARHELELRRQIATAADEFDFDDHDYLEFLLRRDQVDLTEPANIGKYLESLRKVSPKHFRVDAVPGGGAAASPVASGAMDFESARSTGDIDRMIACAPAVQS